MKSKAFIWITILFAALAVPVRASAQKQIRYIIIDVGSLGGTFSQAWGINNNGSVVGIASLPGDIAFHAFVWRKEVIKDLKSVNPTAAADGLLNSRLASRNRKSCA